MLCIPIIGPNLGNVERQLAQSVSVADIVELRIDLFHNVSVNDLKQLKERFPVPMLFTLRTVEQGGEYAGSMTERCHLLQKLSSLHPELLDVQSDTPHDELLKLKQHAPQVRLLASHHDPKETPTDLNAELEKLQRMPTDQYKLATFAQSTTDALRMMELTQQFNRQGGCLTGICMGPDGAITRILASQIGSPLTFTCLDEASSSAPGQIPWRDMLEVYRIRERSPAAMRLGLIGHPVDKSPGHIAHNAVFHQLALDALYAKLRVEPADLAQLIQKLRTVGWTGLAVTMPLKEKIIPFLDFLDPSAEAMGAVNTIAIRNGAWHGFNTDGNGALDAIEATTGPVAGKHALVIGAGGAAKAVAWAAKKRGAKVTITNRTDNRAQDAANRLQCDFKPWSQLEKSVQECNLLLQGTSVGMAPAVDDTLVHADWILPNAIVFDVISKPRETRLLREAKAKGCTIVSGAEMFIYQAVRQIDIWFGLHSATSDRPDLAELYRSAVALIGTLPK